MSTRMGSVMKVRRNQRMPAERAALVVRRMVDRRKANVVNAVVVSMNMTKYLQMVVVAAVMSVLVLVGAAAVDEVVMCSRKSKFYNWKK